MKMYCCKVCGYTVECENLAKDYVCPLCGAKIELFEEVIEVLDDIIETEEDKRIPIDIDNVCIARIEEKCINCGRCKDICQNTVGIKYNSLELDKSHPACLGCGQCILNCPVGALVPKYQYLRVLKEIQDSDKIVVVLTSPAVRVSLGDMFGFSPGEIVEGKMVGALKKIGFDYVFDTTFGADLTIMEEAYELVNRVKSNKNLPLFTSCCPSWVRYAEIFHPELLNHLSSCKSPIGMHTTMIKDYFAKLKNIDPEKIVTVALTPCTAKKLESFRKELNGTCDFVLTASEVSIMLKENGIDLQKIDSCKFDEVFSKGSGGGIIFGNTGGVMESAIRTAYYYFTGENFDIAKLNFIPVRGLDGVKEAEIRISDNLTLNVAVVHTMPNLEKLLENIKTNNKKYHFIEVMNCKGGCIGGGGQPLTSIKDYEKILNSRIQGLYNLDNSSKIRVAHENLDIISIYKNYLKNPGSECSEKLLHTYYEDMSGILKDKVSL